MNAAEAWGVMMNLKRAEAEKVRRFVLAGNATFTLVSAKTGTRFTFQVRASRASDAERANPRLWFVSVLTGSDNEGDFTYLGTIHGGAARWWKHGTKSRICDDAPSAKAFAWFWRKLEAGELPESMVFHHAGKCGRCGRKLTDPESVTTGLGPECATRS